MRIHWGELGDASDPTPIVLLHGISDSHMTWKRIGPALAVDRRVLMPDNLGSGLSDRPDASYELEWHAQMIAAWLQQIGVKEIDLVGHSYGGGVAQMLLLHQQHTRVRKLALLASGGLGRDVGFWLRLATLPGVVEWFGQPFMAVGTRLTLRSLRDVLPKDELDQLTAMNSIDGTARAFARTVRDVIDLRGQRRTFFDRAHELSRVPEIAVCWGDLDDVIPIKHGRDFAQSLQGAVFHSFEGAGHYLHHEQPEALAKTLRAFLGPRQAQLELPLTAAEVAPAGVAVHGTEIWTSVVSTAAQLSVTWREQARGWALQARHAGLRVARSWRQTWTHVWLRALASARHWMERLRVGPRA